MIKTSAEIESLARQVEDNNGVVFVPALTGLGAPHWRSEAHGQITGLTRGEINSQGRREGILVACLEPLSATLKPREQPVPQPKPVTFCILLRL